MKTFYYLCIINKTMSYKITFISDTHTKHHQLTNDLIGGDILIHSGDICDRGYSYEEITDFCKWFDKIPNYDLKIFIAGNHDRLFENDIEGIQQIINSYKTIDYLEDTFLMFQKDDNPEIKIYGAPWQPTYYNWAFNLPRKGVKLEYVWNKIPEDTDILITHTPPFGIMDKSFGEYDSIGCELLTERLKSLNVKINAFGHVHYSYGKDYINDTMYINSCCLGKDDLYTNPPINMVWDVDTNDTVFNKKNKKL